MITRCPNCSTSFHVSAHQLEAASGTVRCGSCLQIFHAPDYQQTEPEVVAPTLADVVSTPTSNAVAPPKDIADEPQQPDPMPPTREGLGEIAPEPVMLEARTPSRWPRRIAWGLVNFLLIAALSVQYIYWNFLDLRTHPLLGATLTNWCNQFRCPPPRRVNLEQLHARKLVMRTHHELENALAVDFLLVNSAAFRQRLPALELKFSRMDGSLAAMGHYLPNEYAGLNAEHLLQPGEARRVRLDITDPGPDAVSYVLKLRAPSDG